MVYNGYNGVCSKQKKENSMASLSTKPQDEICIENVNDEFETYLKRQQVKTTFNGLEIETFSWYKKVLGLL